jgi:hypothetical protein
MTTHPQKPDLAPATRGNALWGRRGGRRLARGAALLSALALGGFGSALLVPVTARSQASDCLLTIACPTTTTPLVSPPPVPTVSLPLSTSTPTPPTVSLPVSTTSTPPTSSTTTAGGANTSPTTPAPGETIQAEGPSTASASHPPLTYGIDIDLQYGIGVTAGRRWLSVRVALSRPANVAIRLLQRKTLRAGHVYNGVKGANRFRLELSRRVRPGRYTLQIVLTSEGIRRTVLKPIRIPR